VTRPRAVLAALVALCLVAVVGAGSASAVPRGTKGKPVHCKKGEVKVRKHGEFVCKKKPAKPTPHPGLDVLGTPGSYQGSNGVKIVSSKTPEGTPQITMTIAFPSGYVSCQGKPPYPTVTVTVADMLVSDFGEFSGTASKSGAYVSVKGHFTAGNSLVIESAGVQNLAVGGERCAAQYTNATVVF
jgi:hypothetical protein